jgi:hypothetical protein
MSTIRFFVFFAAFAAWANAFTLFQDSINDTAIAVSAQTCPSVRLASLELQYHIEEITGIRLPVINDQIENSYKNLILVGKSRYTDKAGIDLSSFGPQEYLITISENSIILIGQDWQDTPENRKEIGVTTDFTKLADTRLNIDYSKAVGREAGERIELPGHFDQQSTLYAVYDFLERFCGVRWYGPDLLNIVIPKDGPLLFEPCTIKRSPDMKYRDGTATFKWPMIKDQWFDADYDKIYLFLRRIRFGGEKWAANHSMMDYYWRFKKNDEANDEQKALFQEDRPDFFAVGYDTGLGSRQLCYTNPDLIRQVADDARNYFDGKKLLGHQTALGDYFAVVPMDNNQWCKCDNCQKMLAMDKENHNAEHFNSGTASHYLFNFVNSVAKEVYKTHPDKKIACLAYHVYAFKPDMELMPNLSVAPCLQIRNYWAPKIRKNEFRFYKEWVEPRDRPVYLWNYSCFPTERGVITGFNVFPGFNIHNQAQHIKMFVNDGVRGIFLCGIGEQLDVYATFKLYNDVSLDIDELLDEFFRLYFGEKSGKMMKKFYCRIEEIYSSPQSYPENIRTQDMQFHQDAEQAWTVLGTQSRMDELGAYINGAYEYAENDIQRARVKSWDDGVWQYMLEGRKKYFEK